ncbi:MAG: HigA family addiction module antitoxin [Bacteroidota bacterium]
MKKKFIQKNAPHPGKILWKYQLEPTGVSVTEAAKLLGIARPNLSAIINGRAGISAVMAMKLSKAFNTSPEFWLNLQSNYDLSQALKNEKAYKHIKAIV